MLGDEGLATVETNELIGALGDRFALQMTTFAASNERPWRVTKKVGPGFNVVGPESLGTDWYKHYVPIIGRVAAGVGFDTAEAEASPPGWADEYVGYDGAPIGAVAVRVIGASMEPQYRSGDIVIVDTSVTVRSGICCILIEDDSGQRAARLKMLSMRGGAAKLRSLNAEFAEERIDAARIAAAYPIHDHLPAIVEED